MKRHNGERAMGPRHRDTMPARPATDVAGDSTMMRIAVFATLGLLPMSLLGQARADVQWIPNVVGMTATAAIDTLRRTNLRIVQLDSITTNSRAGRVVRQRPAAGTPVFGIRAE